MTDVAARMNPASLANTVDVETPELVVLSYTIAGVGSRASAALIDYGICIGTFIGLIVIWIQLGDSPVAGAGSAAWGLALLGVLQFIILWLYYVLFEAFGDGQTPGKRIIGLRVVRDGGLSVTFEASAIRNIVRIVDMQPIVLYAVGLVSLVASARGKRLGDMAAGTIVVKEGVLSAPMAARLPAARPGAADAPPAAAPLASRLTDAEFQLLDRFVTRRMDFDPERRQALGAQLAQQLAGALATAQTQPTDSTPEARPSQRPSQHPSQRLINQLVLLHDEEQAARSRGVASRSETGAGRERHRLVAMNAPRWAAFATQLEQAQRKGLKSLGEARVRAFVQDYREMTSDLARLRTATRGTDAAELFYLNRLVAGAHSLLYRRRTFTLQRLVNFLFADVPAEVRASAVPIALAALVFFGPMVIAWRAVVVQPELAATLLPASMLERAQQGVEDAKLGRGYIEDPEVYRPVMASRILTNNIQVTFFAFAFGMTAGVLTLGVLVMNGVSIGAAFGLYMSKGIGSLIFSFVAPHGVLELSAIVIAGGAGFLLAAGLLLPGQRTRRAALAHNARRAFKLLAGSAFLLVFAGVIEGFVSPNATLSLNVKLAVSAVSAVVLAWYLSYRAPRALSSR